MRVYETKDNKKVLFQRMFNTLYAFLTYDNEVYYAKVTDKTLKFLRKPQVTQKTGTSGGGQKKAA